MTYIRRTALALVSILGVASELIAQSDPSSFSLDRLSISISSSYHFRPWNKYNSSMELLQDAVRYIPTYQNPRGSSEKIRGDGTVEVLLGYRLFWGLSANLIGAVTKTSSDISLSYETSGTYYSGGQVFVNPRINHAQRMDLSVAEYGLGVSYAVAITEHLWISGSASVLRARGRFDFERVTERFLSSDRHEAQLQQVKYSLRSGLELVLSVAGPFSLISAIEYRSLKFPDLRGSGTYTERYGAASMYERTAPFEAVLGEADGYFGIMMNEKDEGSASAYLLHDLWSAAPVQPWWRTQKPATLDLSGLGIKLGVRVDF